MTDAVTPHAAAHPPISARQVAAAVAGNALEFYDFTVYATFASQIGQAFFPSKTPFVSLILTLITFGVGFIPRPLGAVIIGRWADKHGRRPAMVLSFSLMGVAILGLALTPSYTAIGPLAPILVLIWRLCQGFALGGEVGPTTAFLVEASPPLHRGLYGAWQGGSQNIANLVGAGVGLAFTTFAGVAALQAWGWRVAFLIGAIALPFGLLLRRTLPETLHRHEPRTAAQSEDTRLRAGTPVLLQGLGLIGASTISTYVFAYLTTYAFKTLHMPAGVSLGATAVSGTCGLVAGLIGGALSDRFGRRPLMIWPRLFFLLATWPVFWMIVHFHNGPALLIGTAILTFSSALSTAAVFVAIAESLRKEVRVMGMGMVYAVAVAVFGGTTQPVIASLVEFTHDPLSVAWYTIAATAVGLVASLAMRETAHRRVSAVVA